MVNWDGLQMDTFDQTQGRQAMYCELELENQSILLSNLVFWKEWVIEETDLNQTNLES